MRLHSCRGIAPFFLASTVVARSAILFVPHDTVETSILTSISTSIPTELHPSSAALVLLQRSGLSQYYSLHDADQQTLHAINTFGVPGPSVFYNDEQASKPSFTIVVDGVQDPENFVDRSLSRYIKITNPPSSASTTAFLRDLSSEDPTIAADTRCYNLQSDILQPDILLDCFRESLALAELRGHGRTLYHSNSLQSIAKKAGAASELYRNESRALASQITDLLRESSYRFDLTVLLTPLEQPPKGLFGRLSEPQWTSHRKTLSRRQDTNLDSGYPDVTPEDKTLDEHIPENPDIANNADADADTTPPAPVTVPVTLPADPIVGVAQSSGSPRGILPFCYSSSEACQQTTNNCSGHGECTRKYTVDEHSCFSCTCQPERRETGDGLTKTTIWAGPACQKKDVSVPFWLLFGATLGLVGAISWALSLLYSMGNEELPSVLSAGVGGVSARGK